MSNFSDPLRVQNIIEIKDWIGILFFDNLKEKCFTQFYLVKTILKITLETKKKLGVEKHKYLMKKLRQKLLLCAKAICIKCGYVSITSRKNLPIMWSKNRF